MENAIVQGLVDSFRLNFIEENRYLMVLDGLRVTVVITFFSVLLGTVLGGLVCWMRMSDNKFLARTAKVYIDLVRGIPTLLLLLIMFYVVLASVNISGIIIAVITFSINVSAYFCETFRSGIMGVDRGQWEAGLSLGYNATQTFFKIVLPQAWERILPVYHGEIITLLKGTAIVGYVAVVDVTKATDVIRSRTFDAFLPLVVAAVAYFLLAWLFGLLLKMLFDWKKIFGKKRIAKCIALIPLLGMLSCGGTEDVQINDESDLRHVRVGVIAGSNHDITVSEQLKPEKLFRFDDISAMLVALEIGKIDACYIESVTTNVVCRSHPDFVVHPSSMGKRDIGIIFNKQNTALCNEVNAALDILMNDSVWKEMQDRWLSGDENPDTTGFFQNNVTQGAVLHVGTIGLHFPYNYVSDGKLVGFEIEMVNRIGAILNRPVEYQMLGGNALTPALNSGKLDMAATLVQKSPEREKNILFSKPYMHSQTVYVTCRRDNAKSDTKHGNVLIVLFAVLAALLALALVFFMFKKHRKDKKCNSSGEVIPDDGVIVRIEHLKKVFDGKTEVLSDVCIDIHKGEVISVIGPSGSGKSTFLRCINMLERPTGGRIFIDGVDTLSKEMDVASMRRKIGMVFQSFNLFNHRNVLENVAMAPADLLGKSREESEAEAMNLLKMVGLGGKADAMPYQLSGGQKQRVAIARALAMHPEIILFDEPTSALDPTMVSEVLGVIRMLASQGMTMLIVTHEMEFARQVSSRVLYMDEGRIYESGTPEQVFGNPRKEKTRNFIDKVHECRYGIESDVYDYYEMTARINNFCKKYYIKERTADHIVHAVEECLIIAGASRPVSLSLTYSEKTSDVILVVEMSEIMDATISENDEYALEMAVLKGVSKSFGIQSTDTGTAFKMTF